jgi:outer membrane protein TolC
LKATAKVAQAASKTGELTRKQYEAGAVDFQTLLVAQQNEQLAAISLAQAQSNRAGDAIALYQALGGRWWKRESTASTGAKQP